MAREKSILIAYLRDGDGEREVQVEVLNFDRITAERRGPSLGLPASMDGANLQYATLFLFFALTRMGEYDGKWAEFQERDLLDFDPVEEPGDVDPTRPDPPTGPPSSSPGITAEESTSG